jgi:hypothetical protein
MIMRWISDVPSKIVKLMEGARSSAGRCPVQLPVVSTNSAPLLPRWLRIADEAADDHDHRADSTGNHRDPAPGPRAPSLLHRRPAAPRPHREWTSSALQRWDPETALPGPAAPGIRCAAGRAPLASPDADLGHDLGDRRLDHRLVRHRSMARDDPRRLTERGPRRIAMHHHPGIEALRSPGGLAKVQRGFGVAAAVRRASVRRRRKRPGGRSARFAVARFPW